MWAYTDQEIKYRKGQWSFILPSLLLSIHPAEHVLEQVAACICFGTAIINKLNSTLYTVLTTRQSYLSWLYCAEALELQSSHTSVRKQLEAARAILTH